MPIVKCLNMPQLPSAARLIALVAGLSLLGSFPSTQAGYAVPKIKSTPVTVVHPERDQRNKTLVEEDDGDYDETDTDYYPRETAMAHGYYRANLEPVLTHGRAYQEYAAPGRTNGYPNVPSVFSDDPYAVNNPLTVARHESPEIIALYLDYLQARERLRKAHQAYGMRHSTPRL